MVKKQWIMALVLFLMIPLVFVLEGRLFSLINPEIAAGHPNYERNYHLLNLLKVAMLWASAAGVAVLWLLVCLMVIQSKKQSRLWLLLALAGPFGFAVLAMLNDRAPAETDLYARFVHRLNGFVRAGYELCTFVIVWILAYGAMVAIRMLIIGYDAATSGASAAQVVAIQNASGGMWAFSEGCEVMYLVILLYLLWPVVFNIAGRAATNLASSKSR